MCWGTWLVLLGNGPGTPCPSGHKVWPCFVQLGVNCKSLQRPKIIMIMLCCVFVLPVDKKWECFSPVVVVWPFCVCVFSPVWPFCGHLDDGPYLIAASWWWWSVSPPWHGSLVSTVRWIVFQDRGSNQKPTRPSKYRGQEGHQVRVSLLFFHSSKLLFASYWHLGNCVSWIQNYAKHICCFGCKSNVFQIENG